jgi:hypothetical protein
MHLVRRTSRRLQRQIAALRLERSGTIEGLGNAVKIVGAFHRPERREGASTGPPGRRPLLRKQKLEAEVNDLTDDDAGTSRVELRELAIILSVVYEILAVLA